MSAIDAYRAYMSIKQHFAAGSYDYFKYHGRISMKEETFYQRRDCFFYEKLSRKFEGKPDRLRDFLVANLVENSNMYIKELLTSTGDDRYANWRSNEEASSYQFKEHARAIEGLTPGNFNDLFSVPADGHPELLNLYSGNHITLETFIRFDAAVNCFRMWDKQIEDPIIWPTIRHKCQQYAPFLSLNHAKLRSILKEVFTQ